VDGGINREGNVFWTMSERVLESELISSAAIERIVGSGSLRRRAVSSSCY
jgi:hypothetical protein